MSQHENTPQFIKQVPWYAIRQGKDSSSQSARNSNEKQSQPQSQTKSGNSQFEPPHNPQLQKWYNRGAKGHQSTTFRKGACQNCGAMGHNKKECTERPRKVAAKFTQKNIAADDITQDIKLDWEGKRDRWNGYDVEMYKEVIQEYKEIEEIRKMARHQDGQQDPDNQYKHSADPIQLANLPTKNAKNQKYQGLGNVRNRQDYAKYLLNLDENSEYFDPKSRSMKSYDNVAAQLDNLDVIGQRNQLINQQRFAAQQVQLHNSQLSTVALPTMTQKIYKKIKQSTPSNPTANRQLLQKYGQTAPKPHQLQIIEENDEFFIPPTKNKARPTNCSRYEEDVIINDHLSVWGSWYNRYLGWGYACCHSTQKMSYCLGAKGKEKALANQIKIKAVKLREMQDLEETEGKNKDNQQQIDKYKQNQKQKQLNNQGQEQQKQNKQNEKQN